MMTIEKEQKQVSYYGKKTYVINPMLVRRKPEKEKVPDYTNDESDLLTKGAAECIICRSKSVI